MKLSLTISLSKSPSKATILIFFAFQSAKQQLNTAGGVDITINDIIIKAAGLALRDIPDVNSQWHGDVIHTFRNADIAVAVDTGNSHITPVVRAANTKTLSEISADVKELADKAKNNDLAKEEIEVEFEIAF